MKRSKGKQKISNHEKFLRVVILISALVVLCSAVCRAQKLERSGNNFRAVSIAKDSTRTPYTYTDRKGKTYDVYLNGKGKAYVGKTSAKTGKYYRQYMPEITEQISKK